MNWKLTLKKAALGALLVAVPLLLKDVQHYLGEYIIVAVVFWEVIRDTLKPTIAPAKA